MRKIACLWGRIGALVGLGLLMIPQPVYACSACFGLGVDNETTRGISMAMFGLLAVLGIVWGGIGAFFINMRRRTKMLEPEDWVVTEEGRIETQDDMS